MRKSNRPGQNIRQLARQRRAIAIRAYIPAIAIIAILATITVQIGTLPIYIYGMGIVAAGAFVLVGRNAWQHADRADQGAKAEEDIGRDLQPLQRSGWTIHYGRKFRFIGDVDVICQSPGGQVFAIDVKSHGGTVVRDRSNIRRRYGKQSYPFEKNLIKQVKRQATQIKEADGYRYVIPVLAFSNATVEIAGGQVDDVYVVARRDLKSLLLSNG